VATFLEVETSLDPLDYGVGLRGRRCIPWV
jgi:hypothetical protein